LVNGRDVFKVMLLSVIIPVYDEMQTLEDLVEKVLLVDLSTLDISLEIVVIDDCSQDGTMDIARKMVEEGKIRLIRHDKNQGKGAALQTGFQTARGDIVLIQDADLEYDPAEYPKLLKPITDGRADVVYGSRFMGGEPHRVLYFWHYVGNRFLTLLSNMMTNLNLTDMETCFKVFRSEVIRAISLKEKRFGFEPEVTAKIARLGCRIYEVGISYTGRTYDEGKKINWKDGFRALWCIIKYAVVK
jgi:glycosyltransferase involved in cell wall biosynthesis